MRGIAAIILPPVVLLAICLLSRSASTGGTYSSRTTRRIVKAMVEESQRALAKSDRNPVADLANVVTARVWAQATLRVASEETVRRVTGVDAHYLVDQSQRRLDGAVRTLNDRLPRKQRVRVDRVLVTS